MLVASLKEEHPGDGQSEGTAASTTDAAPHPDAVPDAECAAAIGEPRAAAAQVVAAPEWHPEPAFMVASPVRDGTAGCLAGCSVDV